MSPRATRTLVVIAALLTAIAGALVIAGPLNPPGGPITSTYKTLAEVEPRTAINAVNTPGDADSVFRITQPGSYYLTANVQGVAGKRGIEIAAAGVTIDLNGFQLIGSPTSLGGIEEAFGAASPLAVRNGTVRGFNGNGVSLTARGSIVESVQAVSNAGIGINVGQSGIVRGCVSIQNVVHGIQGNDSCIIEACTATENIASGIFLAQGSMISHCITKNNGSSGIVVGVDSTITACTSRQNTGMGIDGGNGCIVESSHAVQNTQNGIDVGFNSNIRNCVAASNSLSGIFVLPFTTIANCTLNNNTADGIRFSNDCLVLGNNCYGNGAAAGDGAGIHATSSNNRIEGNVCNDNDRGIDVDAAANFIARNLCSGNTINWTVVGSNHCLVVNAVLCTPISGNTGGIGAGSTDPNANFSY